MNESAFNFGERGHLAGVWCEPSPKVLKRAAPPVLVWNVGIQHHVGPYRIWVDLARALAAKGFRSLRFDLGNMGDSDVGRGTPGDDVRDAMTGLEKKVGAREFTLVGFCSSVDQLHEVGLKDARVTGMAYVEGYAYKTRRYWQRWPLRFLSTVRWQNKLYYRLKNAKLFETKRAAMDAAELEGGAGLMLERQYPPPEQFTNDLATLTARGVRLLMMYAGLDSTYQHPDQLFDLVRGSDFGDRLELIYMGGADHIFYRSEDRAVAVANLCRWVEQPHLNVAAR
ncbi:MAG: hypothetical protein JNK82_41340 [Myxococcaceae bacterium]|nr:hypothetical protein [Myxococcaceae bacterium]